MQVAAFSTLSSEGWRWRIVDYAGEMLEESREPFSTIAEAVAHGTRRLTQMNVADRSATPRLHRSFTRPRGR